MLVEPGWTDAVVCPAAGRDGVRALFYDDGRVGIEHRCKTIGEDRVICAPRLQLDGGHVITSREPLTVTPSIACPDCGLHGFIREGRWLPC